MNSWEQSKAEVSLGREEILGFVTALAPLAPFLAEELWQQAHQAGENQSIAVEKKSEVGGELSAQQPAATQSVHLQAWPVWNPELAREEMVTLAVQVNGKLRAELVIPHEAVSEEVTIVSQAKNLPGVQKFLEGKELVKAIYVPGRIVSLVVR